MRWRRPRPGERSRSAFSGRCWSREKKEPEFPRRASWSRTAAAGCRPMCWTSCSSRSSPPGPPREERGWVSPSSRRSSCSTAGTSPPHRHRSGEAASRSICPCAGPNGKRKNRERWREEAVAKGTDTGPRRRSGGRGLPHRGAAPGGLHDGGDAFPPGGPRADQADGFRSHHRGRRDAPFLQLNCAALPQSLVESELFGVRKGAFTDARENRSGLFAAAGTGTLFLDEVGELSLDTQAKLLQALEAGHVRPVGGTEEVAVDTRVIAATNRPLETLLREGSFRPDLYYRLNVIRMEIPPLRERREDIIPLVDSLLQRTCVRLGRPIRGVSAAALRRLVAYDWPGNVRELANMIERAVALTDYDTILAEDLMFTTTETDFQRMLRNGSAQGLPLAEVSRAYVRSVLEAHRGNKAAAARSLGIDRRTLYRML